MCRLALHVRILRTLTKFVSVISHADSLFVYQGAVFAVCRPRWENVVTTPGDGRARTGDPLLAKQVLSQLSYIPQVAHLAAGRTGSERGPFWIRTRDLTVISRALSPAELKALTRTGRSRSSTAEAWSDSARPTWVLEC